MPEDDIVGIGGNAFTLTTPRRAFVDIKIERNPFLAWLVYRGEIYSPNTIQKDAVAFSFAWYQVFRGSPWRDKAYLLEKQLEGFRKREFPNAISRLDGFFVFPSKKYVQRAEKNSSFRSENLLEVEICSGARISCYDMDWISFYRDRRSSGNFWFKNYFKGNPRTATPTWEYVVEGKAKIVSETDLDKAAQIVNQFWPGYSELLVSSRDACEAGADGGAILPVLSHGSSKLTFDIKEVESKDGSMSTAWNKLRSFISNKYVFDVH